MSGEIVKIDLEKELQRAIEYADNSVAENTIRSYTSQWNVFCLWCQLREISSMPATVETVKAFFGFLADSGRKTSTIVRFFHVISKAHKIAKAENPCKTEEVLQVISGIKRTLGTEQDRVSPILLEDLRKMLKLLEENTQENIRNRAILTIGFFGGFRRSEIVSLKKTDITFVEGKGVVVKLRKSKTDQEGEGQIKALSIQEDKLVCPYANLIDWKLVSPESKFLFCHVDGSPRNTHTGQKLSDKMIARLISKYMAEIGKDGHFAGHSLRAGFVTEAVIAGKTDRQIMNVTGHKTHRMIDLYTREIDAFNENATSGLSSK